MPSVVHVDNVYGGIKQAGCVTLLDRSTLQTYQQTKQYLHNIYTQRVKKFEDLYCSEEG